MKSVFLSGLCLVLIITIVSCGGKPEQGPTAEEAGYQAVYSPPWWDADTCTSNEEYLCQRATAESKDQQIAINKATTQARAELQAQLEAKLELLVESFTKETGQSVDADFRTKYEQTIKEIASGILRSSTPYRDEVRKDEAGIYRAWVLMRLMLKEAYLAHYKAMKTQDNLYTDFLATEAFKKHEEEMLKYEQYKKDHGL